MSRNYPGLLLCVALLLSSLVQADNTVQKPLKVVASFSVLADMVSQVGREHVEVHSLVGWGEDAHVFHPRPADIQNITKADLLVTNGLGFEGWLDRLMQASKFKGHTLVASSGVEAIYFDMHEVQHEHHGDHETHTNEHDGLVDPHAWLSLSAARLYVLNISTALSKIDPERQLIYRANAMQYSEQLKSLGTFAEKRFHRLTESKKNLVVPHNSFAYLAREYGFQMHSLQGLSTESQASAAQIAQVIRQIRAKNITVIFSENIVNRRLIDQVKNETGVRFGGELISGALSREVAPTYLKMMEYNINTILKALAS